MSAESMNASEPRGVWITAYASCSALGQSLAALRAGLIEGRTGLGLAPRLPAELGVVPFPACVGVIPGELDKAPASARFVDTRQLRVAWTTLRQIEGEVREALERVGPERMGLILGTSTGGIASTEVALAHLHASGTLPPGYSCLNGHAMDAAAQHIAETLDIRGPAFATSSACASGAKALATAKRLIELGVVDAVLAGGIDSLARMTIHGFHSLGVLSSAPCRPFRSESGGMNVAEGGSWLLVERSREDVVPAPLISLLGVGESSDAHHMSAPDPTGKSQGRAMQKALADAQVQALDVKYVNAHGTGTRANDTAEQSAIVELLADRPASSTKCIIGHQLGAAGATEAVIAAEVARGLPICGTGAIDEADFPLTLGAPSHVLSNSFAFGGANISLLLSTARAATSPPPEARALRARVRAMTALSANPNFAVLASDAGARQALDPATMGTSLLGARGRARASELTRLFAEAVTRLGLPQTDLAKMPIFVGSALGQIQTSKDLIELFLKGDASPLAFQGSVHNAVAGVLTIALKNHEPSSSIAGGGDTLFCTLLEAMSYLDPITCPEVLVLVGDETPPTELGLPAFSSAVTAFALTHPDVTVGAPVLEIADKRASNADRNPPTIHTPAELAGQICGEGPGVVAWLLDSNNRGSARVHRPNLASPWDLVIHHGSVELPPLAELLPHRAPLLLLGQVVSFDDQHITCTVDPGANALFEDEGGVDAVVATEWMAQAVGAFVGAKKRSQGRAPRVGFIIGIRKVDFHASKVKNAAELQVTATPTWVDQTSGSFNCIVKNMITNELVAEGSLTVHEPEG